MSACETPSEGRQYKISHNLKHLAKRILVSKANDLTKGSISKLNTSSKTINDIDTDHSSGNSKQSPSTNSSNENNESEEAFYGQWQINKVIAYGSAETYSSGDVKNVNR